MQSVSRATQLLSFVLGSLLWLYNMEGTAVLQWLYNMEVTAVAAGSGRQGGGAADRQGRVTEEGRLHCLSSPIGKLLLEQCIWAALGLVKGLLPQLPQHRLASLGVLPKRLWATMQATVSDCH
jgi:hypothetical protein